MIHKSVFGATGQAALRSGSNILTRGIAEGTGGAVQYNADLLARNIAFGENNKLDFTSDEARKQFMLSFAIGAVAEVPHAFGSFKGYKDMYQMAASGLWNESIGITPKVTVEEQPKPGIIDDRTPESLVAQEIADSRMKSIGLEGAGSKIKFSEMTSDEAMKIAQEYRTKAPIEIPESATMKPASKTGYEQISYKWRDSNYKYEVRWHTRTPGAPENQGTTWVVERTTPGSGGAGSKIEIYSGNQWVSGYEWFKAIKDYQNGTATPQQLKLLEEGHWKE